MRAITPWWIDEKHAWSQRTFGVAQRTEGICKHIEHELAEVRESQGKDLFEWVDIIFLALDGASRAGFSGKAIVETMREKHSINVARKWSVTKPEADQPSFHEKEPA